MRPSLKTGIAFATVTLATEALAVLPGRIALGRDQAQVGRSPVEFVLAGMLRDLSDLALPVGFVIAIALAVTMVSRHRRGESALRIAAVRVTISVLIVVSAVIWLISSSLAEFKLQRGVDATWFDLRLASGWSPSPGLTFLSFLLLRRHLVPGACALVATYTLLFLFRRRSHGWAMSRPLPVIAGFGVATTLGFACALVPLDPNVRVFRTISDRHTVGEPFVNLFMGFGRSQENVRLGMKGLIERAQFSPSQSRGGEALLGLPTPISTRTDCSAHPLARALPVRGVESSRPNVTGHHPLDPDAAHVMALLDRLSAELYAERAVPIDVWQVILESFRGDDIHAISHAAPRDLAPFMNSLYESAERGQSSVIAVHRMWQAGARSSQGLSSYMCGMGMLPYGLSLTRDFGLIPVRCLPDVLVDANFDGTFFYGGNPSFDEMDTFFRHHGIRQIVGKLQLPLSSPTSEGGVSDRALVAHAADLAAQTAGDRARYFVLMSGSNHVPYGRPDDLPQDIEERVQRLERTPEYQGTTDDAGRLRTYAYADLALSELFTRVGRNLERTVFVVGADHATGDPFVWANPQRNTQAAHALIPFVIVLPEPLVAGSAHPAVVREIVRELNEALDDHAWSQNDVPLFVVTLLSHSPGMKAMSPERRWHTLGGERTSPFFIPPRSDVKVVGIDCVSELFGTDEQDRSLLSHETASFVKNENEIYSASPTLIPIAAALSRFLNGYAASCRPTL